MLDGGIEELDGARARRLAAIHGAVGIGAKRVVMRAIARMKADADRGGGEDLVAIDIEGLLEPVRYRRDLALEAGDIACRKDRQQELVAGESSEHVGWP